MMIKDLLEAIESRNLAIFAGAGLSIPAGYVNWQQLLQPIADELDLDLVIFLPAGDPYHKETPTNSPARNRLAMVELAIADEPRFAASNCDIVREGATYTFDTVEIFRQQFPSAELWCLLGMDSLMTLHTWHRWQGLVKNTRIAVAARKGDGIAQAPPSLHEWIGTALQNGRLHLLKAAQFDISSTNIRQVLHQGGDASAWLNKDVVTYICAQRLYR